MIGYYRSRQDEKEINSTVLDTQKIFESRKFGEWGARKCLKLTIKRNLHIK